MALLLAFLSGVAGLVYEVLWAKRLALLFGSTALAQTTVLAAFLGGLSAGNAWLGRRADRASAPWRFYALLEAGVAALAFLAPPLLALLDAAGGWPAVAVVFAQAALMGGTIPALCVACGLAPDSAVARIYCVNSAGAAAGCLLAAFWLIPAFGLDGAFTLAGLVNAAVAAVAWNLRAGAPVSRSPAYGRAREFPRGLVRVAVFLSGFVALAYEQAWTRLLALTMGSSVYSFAEMLAGFISGIALGSLVVSSRAIRARDPAVLLGLACLGAGLSVLLTLPACGRLTYWFVLLRSALPDQGPWAFAMFEAAKFGLCFALMLAPAAFLGGALPLAARLAESGRHEVGRDVGKVFAWNTAGNVLGAFFGWAFLPRFGLEALIRSGTTVHLAVAALILWRALPWPRRSRAAAGLAALAAVTLYRAWLPRWDLRLLTLGVFRGKVALPPKTFADFQKTFAGVSLPFYRDDREATVCVLRYDTGEVALKVNGKTDASNDSDMRTQIYLGQLPLLLKPGARRVLLIGWGSGVTAGSILRHPIARLDAVELIPAVVDASAFFRAESRNPIDDPRLRLHLEDGKTFMSREHAPYDVIISEPSNPWMAGVGSLFSREYYRRARRLLAPGGIMVQWFQVYEMDDALFQTALRTFRSAFPSVTLWNEADSDALLIGSQTPIDPDFKLMERNFLNPAVTSDLGRADVRYLSTLLAMQTAAEKTAQEIAGLGPLNADLKPVIEYAAPKAYFSSARVRILDDRDDRASPETEGGLLLTRYLKARGRPFENREFMDRMLFPHSAGEEKVLRRMIADWKRQYPGDPKADFATRLLDRFLLEWHATQAARR